MQTMSKASPTSPTNLDGGWTWQRDQPPTETWEQVDYHWESPDFAEEAEGLEQTFDDEEMAT